MTEQDGPDNGPDNNMVPPDPADRVAPPRRTGIFRNAGFEAAKRVLFLCGLILIMLIPLGMVEGVVQERSDRKREVVAEIGDQWGPTQTVSTPILLIPYEAVERHKTADGGSEAVKVRHVASFLPAQTSVTADSQHETRHKSIYEVLVYSAKLQMSGSFAAPDFSRWGVAPEQIRWNEASLAILLPGTRALRAITIKADGKPLTVEGLTPQILHGQGLGVDLALTGPQIVKFDIDIALNGRASLDVLPLGGQTEIEIASSWPHPNFTGSPLPTERKIDKGGFTGHWSVNHLATGIPLAWRDGEFMLQPDIMPTVGVSLAEPGDVHQQTERIVKYGLLVVGLTFGTIFIIGLLKRDRVHLVQYLLIGAAISLFYLLLLSLAEQISFGRAYLIASVVDIAIVACYAAATIRRAAGLLTGLILAALHSYMFVLLQMESYALLSGTVGLLIILVLIMVATRKVDWHAIGDDAQNGLGRGFDPQMASAADEAAPTAT